MSKDDVMLRYMPPYYRDINEVVNVIKRSADEIDKLDNEIKDVLDQFFIDTATWGLKIWEQNLGIPTDLEAPIVERRSAIKAKLRGTGVVDTALIKNVAESFVNGRVEVLDRPYEYSFDVYRVTDGVPANTFYIRFVDIEGRPVGLEALKRAIEEIKPAHLVVEYIFLYLSWDELDIRKITWDELDAKMLSWNSFEKGDW